MSPKTRCLLLASALLAGCHDQITDTTTAAPDLAVVNPQAVPSVPGRVKWRVKLDGDYSLHKSGVASDGTVYVGVSNGKLYAIAPDGSQRWIFQAGVGGGVYGPVSVGADGTIYIAGSVISGSGQDGAIFAITPTGTQKWVFSNTNQFIMAGPGVGPDGNIYAVTDYGGIGFFSLTPAGQLRFGTGSFSDYGNLGVEVAFGSGQAYFAFDMYGTGNPPTLFAYDFNGTRRWKVPGPANNSQPAVGPNGNVVIPSFASNLGLGLASYSSTGSLLWNFYEFPGNTEENADVGQDNVSYTVRNLSTLFAFNANGSEKWRYVDPGIMFQPRIRPQNDLVFMGGRQSYGMPGFFLGVSAAGVPLWRVDLPDEPGFPPYGQLVPMNRPVFSPDGNTAYAVTDVAGDGANPYCFLYAIDLTPGAGGGNTAPVVSLVATSSTTINRGGSVSFRGSFTDPDVGDGPWTYNWSFGRTGTVTAPGNILATRRFLNPGTFQVRIRVTDARGGVGASKAVTVRVL